jgi:hypothetical protein
VLTLNKYVVAVSLWLVAILVAVPAAAAQAEAFSLTVPMLAAPPSMNGTIDASWSKAVQIPVSFDFTYQRPGEPATAYVAQDPHALEVAFVVTQREGIVEDTETNGPGVLNDDNVEIDLWPQGGSSGFHYTFNANARGARYQTSSENSAFSPDWTAVARRTASGYVVTMRIPFSIMRAGGSKTWHAQFERIVQATNSDDVWEHEQGQRSGADAAFAGVLDGIQAGSKIGSRPQPRLQFYALGEATNAANGGNTSRIGADLAVPVTATSSFVASVHPDYSNVEVDQQTISPSAFPRFYSEVRPFFTQLSRNYNNTFSCNDCPMMLYTPAIPTYREGYAYEGTQGPLSFAAFDAIGHQRTDDAQVLSYTVNNSKNVTGISAQRVAVHFPGFDDITTSLTTGYAWQKTHDFVYLNVGSDDSNMTTDFGQNKYLEYGVGHFAKDTVYGISYQKIGAQFAPADGFVQIADVQGISTFLNRTVRFDPKHFLQDVQISNFLNEQNNHLGQPAWRFDNAQVNLDFRDQMTLHVYGGYGKNATQDGEYLPFNNNGVFLGYKTQTTTPSSIMYMGGAYYHGSLSSWSYLSTLPIMHNVQLSLEDDENTYTPGGTFAASEPVTRQWLERASLNYQFNRYASFALGARRIVGRNLPNAFQAPELPTAAAPCGTPNGFTPFDCVNAGNVSAAFHFLAAHNEWYIVYGDPNQLSTKPALFVKWIRYIGAEKGT